jgi:hypothetical protein
MKKLLTLALAVASFGFVPAAAEAKTTAETPSSTTITANSGLAQIRVRIGQPRRRRGYYRGYRNYGQWRRNQVGRRNRVVTQTYWRNGRRYTRTVRVY